LGTGQEREIVPKLPSFLLFRWSPDGQTFVTRGQDENGQNGIFLISSQSGEVRAVFQSDSGTFLGFPIWSHDGQAIFYQRFDSKNRREAFVCRDLGSGTETELLQVRPPDYLDNLTLSRDGKCLAYVFGNRETGQQAIHVLPVDADHSRELLQVQGRGFVVTSLEWTRNDKELLFVKTSGDGKRSQVYELMAVMSEGGEPRRLRVFKDYIRDLRLHPEGNVLAFAMGRREIEVWVMEGFLSKVTGAR
jgi:Tol biopolymer transport system component